MAVVGAADGDGAVKGQVSPVSTVDIMAVVGATDGDGAVEGRPARRLGAVVGEGAESLLVARATPLQERGRVLVRDGELVETRQLRRQTRAHSGMK